MRRAAAALLALALLASAGCARHAREPESVVTELEGVWIGTAPSETPSGPATVSVAGNRFHFQGPTRGDWFDGGLVLGPGTGVRTLDLTIDKGDEHGASVRALCRVDGNEMTIAMSRPGSPERPLSLEPARGVLVIYFRRAPSAG